MNILIVCLEIFFGRILDVTLGTVRTVLTVKGKPAHAGMVGFVETFLWFIVVREALTFSGGGLWVAVAYAGGFASGTFIGGIVARIVVKSNEIVQIVTACKNDELVAAIRRDGYGATVLDVRESDFGCEKYMIFCDIPSTRLKALKALVHKTDPKAFIMVQETKHVYNGFIMKK